MRVDIGELQSVDGYMNIALEKTEEYVGGQLKHKYGDVFIRGNNGRGLCTDIFRHERVLTDFVTVLYISQD